MSVILNRGDDRAVLTATGTISALTPDDLDGACPTDRARHVHAASYYLMSPEYRDALPDAFRRFRAAGVTTSVDTNWDPEERWDVDEPAGVRPTYFLPNEAELTAITRSPILDRAIEHRRRALAATVAVKRGERGGVARVGGRAHTGACGRHRSTSSTPSGAGDTFDAGFLAGRLLGRDPAHLLWPWR